MAFKILLADDSMTAQNMGKKILTDAGYDVTAVSNGAVAVKKMAEVKPDIVLLDMYMPGYSGLEVCKKIKGSSVTEQVPVLITVGKLEPFRQEDAMRAKADGFIIKPFEATDLIAVVRVLEERVQRLNHADRGPQLEEVRREELQPLPRPEIPSEAPAFDETLFASDYPPGAPQPSLETKHARGLEPDALANLESETWTGASVPQATVPSASVNESAPEWAEASVVPPEPVINVATVPLVQPQSNVASEFGESLDLEASPPAPVGLDMPIEVMPVPAFSGTVQAEPSDISPPDEQRIATGTSGVVASEVSASSSEIHVETQEKSGDAKRSFWRRIVRRTEPISLGLRVQADSEFADLARSPGEESTAAVEVPESMDATAELPALDEPDVVLEAEPVRSASEELRQATPEAAESALPALQQDSIEPLSRENPRTEIPPLAETPEAELSEPSPTPPPLPQLAPSAPSEASVPARAFWRKIVRRTEPLSAGLQEGTDSEFQSIPVGPETSASQAAEIPAIADVAEVFSAAREPALAPKPEAVPLIAEDYPIAASEVAELSSRALQKLSTEPMPLETAPTETSRESGMPDAGLNEQAPPPLLPLEPTAPSEATVPARAFWRKIVRRTEPLSAGLQEGTGSEFQSIPVGPETSASQAAEIPAIADVAEVFSAAHEPALAPKPEAVPLIAEDYPIVASEVAELSSRALQKLSTEPMPLETAPTEIPPVAELVEVGLGEPAPLPLIPVQPLTANEAMGARRPLWRRIVRRTEPLTTALQDEPVSEPRIPPPDSEVAASVAAVIPALGDLAAEFPSAKNATPAPEFETASPTVRPDELVGEVDFPMQPGALEVSSAGELGPNESAVTGVEAELIDMNEVPAEKGPAQVDSEPVSGDSESREAAKSAQTLDAVPSADDAVEPAGRASLPASRTSTPIVWRQILRRTGLQPSDVADGAPIEVAEPSTSPAIEAAIVDVFPASADATREDLRVQDSVVPGEPLPELVLSSTVESVTPVEPTPRLQDVSEPPAFPVFGEEPASAPGVSVEREWIGADADVTESKPVPPTEEVKPQQSSSAGIFAELEESEIDAILSPLFPPYQGPPPPSVASRIEASPGEIAGAAVIPEESADAPALSIRVSSLTEEFLLGKGEQEPVLEPCNATNAPQAQEQVSETYALPEVPVKARSPEVFVPSSSEPTETLAQELSAIPEVSPALSAERAESNPLLAPRENALANVVEVGSQAVEPADAMPPLPAVQEPETAVGATLEPVTLKEGTREPAPSLWRRIFRRTEPISLELSTPSILSVESDSVATPSEASPKPVSVPAEPMAALERLTDVVAAAASEMAEAGIATGAYEHELPAGGVTDSVRPVESVVADLGTSVPTFPLMEVGKSIEEISEPKAGVVPALSSQRPLRIPPETPKAPTAPVSPVRNERTLGQDVPHSGVQEPFKVHLPDPPRRPKPNRDYPHFVPLNPESGRPSAASLTPESQRPPILRHEPEPERQSPARSTSASGRPHFVPFFMREEPVTEEQEAQPPSNENRLADDYGLQHFRVRRENIQEPLAGDSPSLPPSQTAPVNESAHAPAEQDDMALEIVDRVFQSLRPALMDEVKRLLKEKGPK